MNAILVVVLLVLFLGAAIGLPSAGPPAVALCLVVATGVGIAIGRFNRANDFLLRLYVSGLAIRFLVATLINYYGLQVFFGGDADTYDHFGWSLGMSWHGGGIYSVYVDQFT